VTTTALALELLGSLAEPPGIEDELTQLVLGRQLAHLVDAVEDAERPCVRSVLRTRSSGLRSGKRTRWESPALAYLFIRGLRF
jgi:hypothetical protein